MDVVEESRAMANSAELHEDDKGSPDNQIVDAPTSAADPIPEASTIDGAMMYHFMRDINTRISALEKSDNETTDEATDTEKVQDGEYDMFHTIPEVRECDWEHFKNKYSDEDCNFSIDVFAKPEDWAAELQADRLARMPPDQRLKFLRLPRLSRGNKKGLYNAPIQRIRINSGIILAYLDKTNPRSSWSTLPHTFMAPFKTLIHFHSMIEEDLRVLEAKYGMGDNSQPTESTGPTVKSSEAAIEHDIPLSAQAANIPVHSPDESAKPPASPQLMTSTKESGPPTDKHGSFIQKHEFEALMDSVQAYRDLKLYVNFINERIMPTYRMFEQADYRSNQKVRFGELWSLFRIGELVYQRAKPNDESSLRNGQGPQAAATTHRIWRLYYISQEDPIWKIQPVDSFDESDGLFVQEDDVGSPDNFGAYSIDFDGEKYSGVAKTFYISRYEGEKDIHDLPIFPLRFMKDGNAILEKLKQRGKTFQELLSKGKVALAYDGWTLTHDPAGDVMADFEGKNMTTPEHIDSDVIIDFREAFLTFPHWKRDFSKFSKSTIETRTSRDSYSIIQWADSTRSKQVRSWTEMVVSTESIDELRWSNFAENDRFIYDDTNDASAQANTEHALSDEDLALLPSRLFAYALRDRKFVVVDMANLKEIPPLLNQFNDLKIPEKHKNMILSIVYEHFQKKKARQAAAQQGLETHDQDFIRGKGRGIVILLHGAPGVGKTATAEAVAHSQSKPLFPITCGDLGTTPEVVEERLQETFRLANLWDCILLMDEAEIFLSQRQKNDDSISRNAMVSVFLRTLEYYPGILFLTTNRPGALDEAVKSRVHLSLRYPSLELSETIAIFRMNLNRLKTIEEERARLNGEKAMVIKEDDILAFASKHFHEDVRARWNGRQIRNAFQIAASLAHYQRHTDESQQHNYIGMEHFEDVANASKEYDRYRRDLFSGKDDDELAQAKEDRGYWSPDPPRQESMGFMQQSSYKAPSPYGRYATPPRR